MKTLKFLLATIFFALLVNSCNNPFNMIDTPQANPLPAGKGSLSLKIAGPSGRTIMPEAMEFDKKNLYYKLILTPTDDEGAEKTVKGNYNEIENPVILDLGTYSLAVNAYADEDHEQLLFSGTAGPINITAGNTTPVEITLQPVIVGGTGTFSWDITFPETALSASMFMVERVVDGEPNPIFLIEEINFEDNDRQVQGKEEDLPSGFYNVTITMTGQNPASDRYITVTRKEILHIYNGRESKYTHDFANINFNIVYTVTFNHKNADSDTIEVVYGVTISDYFEEGYLGDYKPVLDANAYLLAGENLTPDNLGYTFGGWYKDEDLNAGSKWDENEPVINHLTLYPQWNSDAIDVSDNTGDTNFAKIVDYINGITTTTNASYTLFIVAEDVTLSESLTIKSGVTLTVTSAGTDEPRTINRGSADTNADSGLFIVGDGAYLTFENITIDGQRIVNDEEHFTNNTSPLVRVNAGGTLTMNDGTVLRNNQAQSGGGVYVNNGTFTMNGGNISDNTAISGGGGVIVVATASSSTPYFTMEGSAEVSDNTASIGGGVSLNGSHPSFTMKGNAKVSRNTATGSDGGSGSGGGVTANGTFTMEDNAEVSDNKATTNGGGVYFGGTTLKLGGNAKIKGNYKGSDPADNNNLYLSTTQYITLGTDNNAPQGSMEIWVQTAPNHNGVIVQSATNGDEQYFHADKANQFVAFAENSGDGQLVLKTATTGLAFELITDGTNANTYRVRKGTVTSGEVVIPAYHLDTDQHANKLPVTEIGSVEDATSGAFYQSNINTNITTVYIPATVTLIGGSAFRNCFQLTSITIPASVTTIGARALFNCTKLTTVTFASNSQLATIGQEAFSSSSITGIEIPASVTNIDENAFSICTDLETVTFADGSRLTTIGNGVFSNCENLTNITIPAGVTTIGNEAFYGCSLPSIEIPASVTNIDEGAFSDCTDLETVTFVPSSQLQNIGDRAFLNCESLTGIIIPASVTEIGRIAFRNCTGLETVTFAANSRIQSISSSAFHGCISLKTVTFSADSPLETIGSSAFSECESLTSISIPASVTSIEDYAFSYCIALTSITIPAGVTSIGEGAFSDWKNTQTIYIEGHASESAADAAWGANWRSGCNATRYYLYGTGLQFTLIDNDTAYSVSGGLGTSGAVVIPSHYRPPNSTGEYLPITEIAANGFSNNTSITGITIPATVTSIGDRAFENCSGLVTVTFAAGSQLATIGDEAFSRTNIASITIPASVTAIGESAFEDVGNSPNTGLQAITFAPGSQLQTIGDSAFRYSRITSIDIPDGVTTISNNAFSFCASLESITIPVGVTTIGDSAFTGCTSPSLTSITIPEGVTTIGDSAFTNCANLTSITIPDSVESIGFRAFFLCDSLTPVTCLATNPPTLGNEVFSTYPAIKVPADSVNAYKGAPNWSALADYISAID